MCGICGFTGATESDYPTLKAMCDVIAHRGPDGEGQYIAHGIALGHRRLSLIDLKGGSQPMVRVDTTKESQTLVAANAAETLFKDEAGDSSQQSQAKEFFSQDGAYAIVFNGEIYNYQDLRAELAEQGWSFSTTSDTEVLLVSYLAWGKEALNKLRGMFAFAIWDAAKQELFCARDFFGIKPFYYTIQEGQFIFASEIKSILEHPAYERELNERALDQYLCYQFSALRETFFKEVYKLEPATCLTFKLDGTFETERYWQPEFKPDHTRTYEQTVEAIDAVIKDSVKYHNVADVEVGSFLSSGIDSSYLAATLAQVNPDIKTFTVGFSEYVGERDEISWADELAKRIGIYNAHKHINEQEYWECLPRVQWHMDEPLADPSAIALYFVDQLAATEVKAVLSGEGADEFFSGYRIYQVPLSNERISFVPRPIRALGAKTLGALHLRGANYLERSIETPKDWYYTNANGAAFTNEERARVLKNPSSQIPTPESLTQETYREAASYDQITQMQYCDLFFWLVGDILLKTDKMSMAHSLESRVPFLDKEVFKLAASIPTDQRINSHQTKISLREASERVLPKDWAQKEKLGFPVPLVAWLREDEHANEARKWFTSAEATQFFNTEELSRLIDDHVAEKADNSRKIWIIWMFLMWYRIYFVDREVPAKPFVKPAK